MKVTKSKLKQVIKEELNTVLKEVGFDTGRIADTKKLPPRSLKPGKWRQKKQTKMNLQKIESQRLMNHFFGKYDRYSIRDLMRKNQDFEDLITQLYGWALPGFNKYSEPGDVAIEVAQEYEKENKTIIGNESAFLDRMEELIFKRGKEEFEKAKEYADVNPARNVAASSKKHAKALADLVQPPSSQIDRKGNKHVIPKTRIMSDREISKVLGKKRK